VRGREWAIWLTAWLVLQQAVNGSIGEHRRCGHERSSCQDAEMLWLRRKLRTLIKMRGSAHGSISVPPVCPGSRTHRSLRTCPSAINIHIHHTIVLGPSTTLSIVAHIVVQPSHNQSPSHFALLFLAVIRPRCRILSRILFLIQRLQLRCLFSQRPQRIRVASPGRLVDCLSGLLEIIEAFSD